MRRLPVAILGTGNIGTDLLVKVLRSPLLECVLFAGRNLSSAGMKKASQLNVEVSANGIDAVRAKGKKVELVFDATSAESHLEHADAFREEGIVAVDLTPAKIGKMCVPAVNLKDCLSEQNVNMVTCGGQASIPLASAISKANESIEYIETVSSIASRSAGPATRINLDEYLTTTEQGLHSFTAANQVKAILNLNPANPCVHMKTTVIAKIKEVDLDSTVAEVKKMVSLLRQYVPGYNLVLEPILDGNRLMTIVEVDGVGDYLPRFAGNLDIINCAAIAFAEALAEERKTQ